MFLHPQPFQASLLRASWRAALSDAVVGIFVLLFVRRDAAKSLRHDAGHARYHGGHR